MEGFVDIQLRDGETTFVRLLSNRGIQVMNPRLCRLNFYKDAGKTVKCFAMREGWSEQVYQNINISGEFYIEPIGLNSGETTTITINLM